MLEVKQKRTEAEAIKISQVCEFIEANIRTEITLIKLVEFSGLSYQDLIQLFKMYKNTTPMQYARSKRQKLGL